MFREYKTDYTPPAPKQAGKEVLHITGLNGDAIQIPYLSFMTMSEVKRHIAIKLNIPPNKQKLLHQEKEVQVTTLFHYFIKNKHSEHRTTMG